MGKALRSSRCSFIQSVCRSVGWTITRTLCPPPLLRRRRENTHTQTHTQRDMSGYIVGGDLSGLRNHSQCVADILLPESTHLLFASSHTALKSKLYNRCVCACLYEMHLTDGLIFKVSAITG